MTTITRMPPSRRPIRGRVAAALTAAVLLAGCGSSATPSSTTSTTTKHPAPRKIYTYPPAKAHRPGVRHVGHHAKAVTSTLTTSTPHAKPSPPPPKPVTGVGAPASLSGNGDQPLPTLLEKTTVVLEYSTSKPPLQIFNLRGFLLVNSSSSTGTVRLTRGTYAGLHVSTKGHWTIKIRASA